MAKSISVYLQYLMPKRALTALAGKLARCKKPWLKNALIRYFLRRFDVDMRSAVIENPLDYANFNLFFTRKLKPELRPIASAPDQIACPVDGTICQIGDIKENTLFQAKQFDFTLKNLLGGFEKNAGLFQNGNYGIFYLAPKDYHRVHLPFSGKLRESIFIPGKLFSVNQKTTDSVANLFARNERLVSLFDTEIGPMAVIMVGAMLVGSIETVWHANTKTNKIVTEKFGGSLSYERGAEMGYFEMGSTVILLFGKDKISWNTNLQAGSKVQYGEWIASLNKKG